MEFQTKFKFFENQINSFHYKTFGTNRKSYCIDFMINQADKIMNIINENPIFSSIDVLKEVISKKKALAKIFCKCLINLIII